MPDVFNIDPSLPFGSGGTGGSAAAPPIDWSSTAWGSKPNVPLPTDTLPGLLSGNIANLGQLYGLAGSINQFQTSQAPLGLVANLPNYQAMMGQSSGNALAELRGQVPQDVITQLEQQSAERGVSTGQGPNSANTNAEYLRALGLTSIQMQQLGQSTLAQDIGLTPQARPFDVSSMLVTPAQQQQAAVARALYAAAPDPAANARARWQMAQSGLAAGQGALGPAGSGAGSGLPGAGFPTTPSAYSRQPFDPSTPMVGGPGASPYSGGGFTPTTPSTPWGQGYQMKPYKGPGTTSIVPPGAQYDPSSGTYYDPQSDQYYDENGNLLSDIDTSISGVSTPFDYTSGGGTGYDEASGSWIDSSGQYSAPMIDPTSYYDTTTSPDSGSPSDSQTYDPYSGSFIDPTTGSYSYDWGTGGFG